MAIVYERDPWGWVHPMFYRRMNLFADWDDFIRPALEPFSRWNHLLEMGSPITPLFITHQYGQNSDKYEVKLNVKQFAAHELEVKLVNNILIIEGKHEDKRGDSSFISSRHFMRKELLPPDVKPEDITCDLSADGMLQISAPRRMIESSGKQTIIPIAYTGKSALTFEGANTKEHIRGSSRPMELVHKIGRS